MKECEYCGEEFIPIRKTQRWCCAECRKAARRTEQPIIKCGVCGKEFQRTQMAQKYCCYECSQEAKRRQMKTLKKKKIYENKKCMFCGKEFIPRTERQMTCGAIECQKALSLERKKTKHYKYEYAYQKDEGIQTAPPKKKKKKYSLKEWNALTPKERWELMTLNEVSAENLKYHYTYGESETLARWGRLPSDYGKRERKKKQCLQSKKC